MRIDFPRIPFAGAKKDFNALSELGQALVDAHLLKKPWHGKLAVYHGTGGHEVEGPRYSPQEEAVWISKTRCFKPVRNRCIDFLAQMNSAKTWPWNEDRVAFFRTSVRPYLYGKPADVDEAADWKRKLEAEAARLDAAR